MWFHGTYLKDKFHAGQKIALYGKLEGSRSGNALGAIPGSTRFKMIQPTFEILPDSNATGEDAEFILLEMGRIVPVYESLGGKTPWGSKLTSRWTRRILWTIFKDLAESEVPPQTPSSRPERSAAERPPVFRRDRQRIYGSTGGHTLRPILYSAETGNESTGAPSSPTASSSAKAGSHNASAAAQTPLAVRAGRNPPHQPPRPPPLSHPHGSPPRPPLPPPPAPP